MTTTTLMPNPKQQYFAIAGIPLVGGKIYTYAAGTTNPKATYTDAAGTIAQPNPIQLNARGEPPSAIFWSGNYRVDVRDALGNLIYSVDNFNADPYGVSDLGGKNGSSNIGFLQSGAGAVQSNVQTELRAFVRPEQFGAVGDGVADDTAALNAAIMATIKTGGFGTVLLKAGKRYNFTQLSVDGVLGLTIRGENGGNVGNLSSNSSGGASMLVCTSAAGDAISFTGQAYHAAQITLEDLVIVANTPGYALVYNNVSQVNATRVTVTNAGGTAYNTGNGVRFSACYYVYWNECYIWKTGNLYSVGAGITIDKGNSTDFLAGLYNFTNCSLSSWYSGMLVGNQSSTPSGNEHYANINYINSEVAGCSQGLSFYYGTNTATVRGCYLEGNLENSVGVFNKATTVTIEKNFFNGFSSSEDIQLGLNGAGATYPMFYNVVIRSNLFSAVNKYGVKCFAGAGSSVVITENHFQFAGVGAVGVSLGEAVPGNLNSVVEDNRFTGFPDGAAIVGTVSRGANNLEYDVNGALVRGTRNNAMVYSNFADFTQIMPNDAETTVITNTTAGARYINATVATGRHRRQFITLTAASTQNVRLMASNTTTTLATMTPGKAAMLWNDGTNEYASLLP